MHRNLYLPHEEQPHLPRNTQPVMEELVDSMVVIVAIRIQNKCRVAVRVGVPPTFSR